MAKVIEDIGTLKINLLSQAQYDAEVAGGTIQPNELYLTPSSGTGVSDVEVDGESVVSGGVAEIDLTGKADVGDIPTAVSELTNDAGYITGYTETDPIFLASAAHGISSSDISNWNGKSNFSGDYNDLTNKPTIPTVNNATLTIQKNGTNVQTFTANASSNKTANITVPTAVSDLTNDAGYITGYTETDPVFSASASAGITSSDISAWNGKSDFSGDYNDLTNKPTIPTVPTDVSAFVNDAGYITGYTETDPTVPSWAKQVSKPTYTAAEVGAVPTTRTVNGKALSSDITLSASDVSALPSSTSIPSNTSDLINDSGFITSSALPTSLSDLINDMNVSDFPNDAGYSTQTIYASQVPPTAADGVDGDVWFVY